MKAKTEKQATKKGRVWVRYTEREASKGGKKMGSRNEMAEKEKQGRTKKKVRPYLSLHALSPLDHSAVARGTLKRDPLAHAIGPLGGVQHTHRAQ